MRYIWRVEGTDGRGMYMNGAFRRVTDWCEDDAAHPGPLEDMALGFREKRNPDDWYFGFATLKQVRKWIFKKKWRKGLHEEEMLLVKFEVPDEFFARGESQAIFVRWRARIVEKRRVDYMGIDKSQALNSKVLF